MIDTHQAMTAEVAKIARQHGISEGAAQALYEAVRRGGGGQAQFSHPDLGGMGQWSRGGLTQVGDMFNDGLKAQVAAACQDLAQLATGAMSDPAPMRGGAGDWWPDELGSPASSGAQNGMRYACFPERRRLVIERQGKVIVYDTGHYRLTGFSQQQSTTQDLVFSGPDGTVRTDNFRIV